MSGKAHDAFAALTDEQANSGEIRNARAAIYLTEGDPAGALGALADVLDGTAPVIGYVRRKSALRPAEMWNQALQGDPIPGPDSGYIVRVSDSKDADGTWKLVWCPITDTAPGG